MSPVPRPDGHRPGGRGVALAVLVAFILSAPLAGRGDAWAAEPPAWPPASSDHRPRATIGVLAYRGADRALSDWQPTLDHLEAALPDYRFRLVPVDHQGLERLARRQALDFLLTNPGHYVELEARLGAARLATRQAPAPASPSATGLEAATGVGAAVIVRAEAAARTLIDLRGLRLAIVGEGAFGGFQVAWRELAQRGLDPRRSMTLVPVGFPMETVIEAVVSGAADAGVVRACLIEEMAAAGRLDASALRVLDPVRAAGFPCALSTRLYPDWPLARLPATPEILAKRVASALLAMPVHGPGGGWTVPQDYQPVHELFRALGIGPYAPREISLERALARFWPWLAALLMAFVLAILHAVRVEALVRRRTAELAAVNQRLEREMADRQRAEEAARQLRASLEHAGRLASLGEVSSTLAHELNQPLGAIVNYARGMVRRLDTAAHGANGGNGSGNGNGSEALRAAAAAMAGQAERAAQIIARVRAFARRRAPVRAPLDLGEAVGESLALLAGDVARAGIALDLTVAPGLPRVLGDRVQVQQVVLNLVRNAADALAGQARQPLDPPPAIAVTVSGDPAAAPRTLVVTVRDNGPGLAPEAAARLFEPYFTTKTEGLGLGLTICRSIIEAHEGRLWFAAPTPETDQAPGQAPGQVHGTVVCFTLPALSSSDAPSAPGAGPR